MIKFSYSEKAEEIREEFKKWLLDHPPPKVEVDSSLTAFIEAGKKWQKALAQDKWVGLHWPVEYGGRGLSLVEEAVVQEELVRCGSPQLLGLFGLTMVGPVLIKHGTEQQKKRFLKKILLADEIWCQGFSEPGAGSDLAAVSTFAKKTKGGYLLSGQKVWTSFAQIADWCFVLCRTSKEEKKHKGLSYLLVNMKQQGIKVRPLKQITGDEEFNEVFFDEVFVPEENLVGKEGEGWKIAIATLMYERVILTFARMLQSEVALSKLLLSLSEDERERHLSLFSSLITELVAVRALAYSHLIKYAGGATPGPEGSLDKLFWSESFQKLCKTAVKVFGERCLNDEDIEAKEVLQRYLYSRGRTIAAGTSEIQRNIIAERILGLPRLKFAEKG
ncbi:MAG: acyl-CoA dehydrogenase [Candidatus Dadabacteria bacterium]|nr:MAG: acyl-CoA dehydrogenase [Candidatus Dadabacteria bacterium]